MIWTVTSEQAYSSSVKVGFRQIRPEVAGISARLFGNVDFGIAHNPVFVQLA
jgi:hypothetical protein